MKKIIFDLLNNDGGELEAIKAAKKFAIENPNYYLILVGNEKNITSIIDINKVKNIEIFQSDSITHKVDNFRELLRQKSSMLDSFDLMETKNADGLLSSGDSGAFISIATLKIKRLNGVSRPAFMPIIPSILNSNFFLFLPHFGPPILNDQLLLYNIYFILTRKYYAISKLFLC